MGWIWLKRAALAIFIAGCGGGGGDAGCTSSTAPAGATDTSATLTWGAPSDSRVVGYRVYYGNGSRDYMQAWGTGAQAGNCTTYVVTNLNRGATYYFAVTAYDASGNESDFSNEASKSIP
jgi:chitodextrinase